MVLLAKPKRGNDVPFDVCVGEKRRRRKCKVYGQSLLHDFKVGLKLLPTAFKGDDGEDTFHIQMQK